MLCVGCFGLLLCFVFGWICKFVFFVELFDFLF